MRKAISLVVCATLLVIAPAIYSYFTSLHVEDKPFNAYEWQSLSSQSRQIDPGCVRGGMAVNLINKAILQGKVKSEVVNQLGIADVTHELQIQYSIGQCHWDWKHSSLVVSFDTNQSVKRVFIAIDE